MRRLLALVTALAVATACAPGARQQTAAPAAAAPAPLLWRVERGPTRSHLFGTMHIGVTMADGLTPLGLAHLDDARRVVVELDLAAPEAIAQATRQMAARGILPPGESLRAMLPPAQWATLVELHDGAIPAAALDRLQPWFAALSTVGRLELRRAAADATGPTARRAKGAGIPVEGLERAADQVRAFGDLGRAAGLAILGELLDDVDEVTAQLRTLQGAYAGGDNAAALAAYVGAMTRDSPALTELLLFRRNRRWMPHLQRRFLEGGAFVAVGAAHLFGEEGLIALLRARGWTVTRERPSEHPGQ